MHDDSLNADLAEALVGFTRGHKEQVGRLPAANEFAEILTLIVQTTGENLFSDASNRQLKAIELKFLKKKPNVNLSHGDIYCFPSKAIPGKCVFVGFLGQVKPYGDVFVSFRGLHDANANIDDLIPFQYPFVSSDKLIQQGEWKFVGNKSDLLSNHGVFPEVYLNKAFYPKREDIGSYGLAQRKNPDGSNTKRNLTKEEAQQIGIFQNRNDVMCQPEVVEDFIKSRNWI
jgi:hypothetical protein